jgi:hypothetical protein
LHILVDELTKDVSLMVVDFAEKKSRWGNSVIGKSNIRFKTSNWFASS